MLTVPDKQIETISALLEKKFQKEERAQNYAPIKEVLTLLGKGALLSMLFIAPGTARAVGESMRSQYSSSKHLWKRYNQSYLRKTIHRLLSQRLVEVDESDSETIIQITEKGKRRILKYALEELTLDTSKKWDKKWRIVIYDIPVQRRRIQREIRSILKRMKFLKIQKSVYISPYPCDDEIEFIRSYYNALEHITLLTVGNIEHEKSYREYFGLE